MAIYYFNTLLGSDSNTSTQAQSQSTPWASVAKFNSFFPSSSPGDQFLFFRGQTFSGPMVVGRSGSSGSPITIGAYGATGADPIISGLVSLTSWTSLGSNLWQHTHNAGTNRLACLLVGGNVVGIGRFPTTGWYKMSGTTGSAGNASTIVGNMPTTVNWAASGGAGVTELVVQKEQWVIDKHLITAQSGATISFVNTDPYLAPSQSPGGFNFHSPVNDWGYFVQNDVRACTVQNAWCHNPNTNVLKMYSTTNPNGLNVAAAGMDKVLDLSGRSYISFESVSFRGANIYNYYQNGGGNNSFLNCEFAYCGFNNIDTSSTSNIILDGCFIHHAANCGGYMRSSNSVLTYGQIENIGMIQGMGANNNQANLGFLMASSGGQFTNNAVAEIGYIGLYFNGDNFSVTGNSVNNYCLKAADGGGIYASGNAAGNNSNRLVANNIVTNGYGERGGTPYSGQSDAHGIYMDDSTTSVEIRDNTVDTVSGACYFLHNTQDINLYRNNAINGTFAQFLMQHDSGRLDILNCLIHDNTFVSRGTQPVVVIYSSSDNVQTFGNFYFNLYSRIADPSVIVTKVINGAGTTYSLPAWKSAYGWDSASVTSPAGFVSSDPSDIIYLYNPFNGSSDLPLAGTFVDRSGTVYSGYAPVPGQSGLILFEIAGEVPQLYIVGFKAVYV